MEQNSNLAGMSAAEAKEHILSFIATLKLTEKAICSLEEEAAKWKGRTELARSKGMDDLSSEAEKESERINKKLAALREEENDLLCQTGRMKQQIPALAAGERSIDPDLLEQELLMLLGYTAEEAGTERAFRKLENSDTADGALEALKAIINGDTT